MNVFYLDHCPEVAASQHIWHKHVVKMILEYAQMLSTAHRLLDGTKITGIHKGRKKTYYVMQERDMHEGLYNVTHINHPSAVWVRESWRHYGWVYECMMALGEEYKVRTGKNHKTIVERSELLGRLPKRIPNTSFVEPPQCMPEEYKVKGDAVAAYNNYYDHKKAILL